MIATRVLLLLALLGEAVTITTSILLIVDARRDVAAVRTCGVGNGRSLIAAVTLRTETLRLLAILALSVATITVLATVWDPAFPVDANLLAARVATVVAVGALLAQSLTVYNLRRRLFDGYRTDRPTPTSPPLFHEE